jgi:spore coat polysaccharide biosynthesis protein SpsF
VAFTVCVIQARMGSTRLPGKVMMDLGGEPVISRVIRRCAQIPGVDRLVCAIPDGTENERLAERAQYSGAHVVRGSETDVLGRTRKAAFRWEADIVVRVTSDCPLIDPEICAQVIALRKREGAAYASNVWPRSYPQGLDCEAFTFSALDRANREATEPHDREHVTPWIVRNSARVNLASGRFDLARMRWTLDTSEDLEFARAIYAVREPAGLADTLAILAEHPEITPPINRVAGTAA